MLEKLPFLAFLLLTIFCNLKGNDRQGYVELMNPPQYNRFMKLSVEQGLSQSTVFSILEDSRGFMWFGTRTGGLNRYNGYEFTVFKNNPQNKNSLSSNEVISLYEDFSGTLWVGTRNGGLNRFDLHLEKFEHIELAGVSENRYTVSSILSKDEHTLWLGTCKGLYTYDILTNQTELVLDNSVAGNITSVTRYDKNRILLASTEKLTLYNIGQNRIMQYSFHPESIAKAPGDKITPVFVDYLDNIWVGSVEGLLMFTLDSSGKLKEQSSLEYMPRPLKSDIRTIKADKEGNVWLGTFLGLVSYNRAKSTFMIFENDETNPISLGHNSIYSFLVDENNTIWVGTWGAGVNLMSDLLSNFEHYLHQINDAYSLSDNIVSSFTENFLGIWIGTEQGGLNYFDPAAETFHKVNFRNVSNKNIHSEHIKSLLTDSQDNIWIGTFGDGLYKLSAGLKGSTHMLPERKIFALAQTPDGSIWVGTMNGLYRLDSGGDVIQFYTQQRENPNALADDLITSLFIDSDQELWIGTKNGGLHLYNQRSNSFKRFVYDPNDANSLNSDYVFSIAQDQAGNILVGTLQGLDMINKLNGQVTRLSESLQLSDNVINGLLSDDNGNIWLATNKGLILYDKTNQETISYDFRDGLQSNEFNRGAYFKCSAGKLYFGGINGFNRFSPNDIKENPIVPKIQFTDLKLFYKSVVPGEEGSPLEESIAETSKITLTHSQSAFSIEFVALNYILPEKNQYAYFLEGYDQQWNYVGNRRSANYMNLKSGKYTFHVRASNNDNVWNEEGISMQIIVLPPFWRTSWAYVILGLILFGMLMLARAIVISRIKQKNMLEYERSEMKRIEELNNMKIRFFTDISHEFKTPLTLIASPVEKLNKFNVNDKEFKYLISVATKNTNRLKRLVEQLMTFRRLEKNALTLSVRQNDLEALVREVVEDFAEMADNKQIRLKVHCQKLFDNPQWFDRNFLDKILFNLISNALKYTPKGGNITVFLTIEQDFASVKVCDSGVGIDSKRIHKIFDRFYTTDSPDKISSSGTGIGLALAKSLVEIHKGTITVESKPNTGTTFTVTIPVAFDAFGPQEIFRKEFEANDQPVELKGDDNPDKYSENECENNNDKVILIVEDNEDLKNYLANCFKEFNTVLAENGVEAIEITENIIPDVIISDVMMPKMDGMEFCKRIRENDVTSHIPLILLTAKTDITDKTKGIETGADAYIEKPFDLDLLKATVSNLLQQRQNLKKLYSKNLLFDNHEAGITPFQKKFLDNAQKVILQNISEESFSINELGEALNLSRSQLFRKFKTICDINPGELIRNERLKYAMQLLKTGEHNVNEIADRSGFSSASYFITCFRKKFGKTPNELLTDLRH